MPDLRSPAAFLRWHLGQQRGVIVAAILVGILWQLPLTVGPWLVGKAVDEGILGGSTSATLTWAGLPARGHADRGGVRHRDAHPDRAQLADRAVRHHADGRPQDGPDGPRPAAADADRRGAQRGVQRLRRVRGAHRDHRAGPAQLVAYLVVAAIVLNTSPTLGVLVLVAAPVLVGVALPLLRPLHRRQEIERSRSSELTSMATDIVAGLRILRGIGGERTFGRNYASQSQRTRQAGVSAGIWQAAIEAIGVLFSGCFLVLLMWAGTREVLAGDLTRRPADQLPGLRPVHGRPDPDASSSSPRSSPAPWSPRARRSSSSSRRRRGASPRSHRRRSRTTATSSTRRPVSSRPPGCSPSWSAPSRRPAPSWPTGWAATCPPTPSRRRCRTRR